MPICLCFNQGKNNKAWNHITGAIIFWSLTSKGICSRIPPVSVKVRSWLGQPASSPFCNPESQLMRAFLVDTFCWYLDALCTLSGNISHMELQKIFYMCKNQHLKICLNHFSNRKVAEHFFEKNVWNLIIISCPRISTQNMDIIRSTPQDKMCELIFLGDDQKATTS